jgi:hypothetical protein
MTLMHERFNHNNNPRFGMMKSSLGVCLSDPFSRFSPQD